MNKICTKFENDVSKLQEIKREPVSWGFVAGVGAMEHDALLSAVKAGSVFILANLYKCCEFGARPTRASAFI